MTFLLAVLLAAQTALAEPPGRFVFRSYGSGQGLGNLSIVSILQDAEGYLWVATEDGLYRYDGDRFHRLDADDGLPSNQITALALGTDGRLSVGTVRGVAQLRDGRFQTLAVPNVQINALAPTPEGTLWVATGSGLLQQRGDKFVAAEGWPAGMAASSVWADDRGVVAAAQRAGIWVQSAGKWRSFDAQGERIDAVVRDRKGVIWARSPRRLFSLAGDRLDDHSSLLPGGGDTGFLWLDRQAILWVPTNSGLLFREDDQWRVLGPQQGLPASWGRAAMEDREGSIWIGATGLHRLVGRGLWRIYSTPEGLPSEVVWTEWRDRDGTLYVGTGKGLVRAREGRFELVGGSEGHAIRAIAQTPDGALWMGGSPPEVLRLDRAGGWRRFGAESGVAGEKVLTLLATSRGELLLGTLGGGLLRLDAKQERFSRIEVPGGNARERFSQIIEDRRGQIWAAGDAGLAVQRKGEWSRLSSQHGLRDDRVSYVLERRSGDMCVAYHESLGFSCFQPTARGIRALQNFDGSKGLYNNRVYQLGEDRNARLWVGTGQGADVFDAHGVEHFGDARGMAGDDCDATAFLADADGDVWIGTSTGLGRFIGGSYSGPPEPPRPAVVSARLGDTRLLRSGQRVPQGADAALEVHFAGLSFVDEARIQHQVRLLPLESEFRDTAVREARYSALMPGNYSFEVRARMAPGQWSEPARLDFVLLPRWWQTAWCRALLGIAATVLIAFAATWRVRALERRNRELAQQVSVRTSELAAANQALRDLAVSDTLTGLKNRRYLELTMPETVAQVLRARRGPRLEARRNSDLLLGIIDLDDFKTINDTWGHAAGDLVLQQAGQLVAQLCRESDSAVRWGGEEFLVVGRNADRFNARAFAERTCELFRAHLFEVGGGQRVFVTCSVGLAPFPLGDSSWEQVVELADRGLYAAKRAGKDGWALVEAPGPLPVDAPRGRDLWQLVQDGHLTLTLSRQPPEPRRAVE